MLDFKLNRDYRAQNVIVSDDGYDNDLPKFKDFQAGQSVSGKIYVPISDEAKNRLGKESVIVDEAYIIPKDITSAINVESANTSAIPNTLKNNATKIGKGLGAQLRDTAKSYYKGALIGAVLGGGTAMYFKKNLWLGAVIGAMGLGYVSYKLVEGESTSGFITKIPRIN